jgi:6-phosphogluconate dehydrogenase
MPAREMGVIGLGTIGGGLARNLAAHGFHVAVYNRTHSRTEEFIQEHGQDGNFVAAATLEQLARALKPPRAIAVLVNAGRPVDEVIDSLTPVLSKGDIIIDGGNSFFQDTRRRAVSLESRGFGFLGCGVSGGEEGALKGPSLMPGGTREAYAHVEDMLTAIAAEVDGVPCCTYIGPDGAGHFVKMVHNGIEYADIQLIAETYDLLRTTLGLSPDELAGVFREWNQGRLQSYLIEIASYVLAKHDDGARSPLVDVIEDEAEQKGTGRWTSQSALELGVPLASITEAVFARTLSSQKERRVRASKILRGPSPARAPRSLVQDAEAALYASKIVAYAQGFEHLAAASREYGWNVDLAGVATIWRGGCIIRARLLHSVKAAYESEATLDSLMLTPAFADALAAAQDPWRRVVKAAVDSGVPIPALASSLAYYDGYRRGRGPANLIQGLRDYFGSHTYHRVDREGAFHTRWAQDGAEVRTD